MYLMAENLGFEQSKANMDIKWHFAEKKKKNLVKKIRDYTLAGIKAALLKSGGALELMENAYAPKVEWNTDLNLLQIMIDKKKSNCSNFNDGDDFDDDDNNLNYEKLMPLENKTGAT